jgi:hypothetical protein
MYTGGRSRTAPRLRRTCEGFASPRGLTLSGCDYTRSTTTSCTRPTTSSRPNCQASCLSSQVSRPSCQSSHPSCPASHLLTSRHADYSTRSSVKLSHTLIFFYKYSPTFVYLQLLFLPSFSMINTFKKLYSFSTRNI